MTEYNIFCYAEEYDNKDSFQQARYRAFNKEVGKERYNELVSLIKNDILKDCKLELNKNSWEDEWKKITDKQLKRLQEIPEFDKEVFEGITGIKDEKLQDLTGKTIEVEIEGKKYKAKLKQ